MTATSSRPASPADAVPTDDVRRRVRESLINVPSFRSLSAEERRRIAHNLVQVWSYLANPTGGNPELTHLAGALAEDPGDKLRQSLATDKPNFAGSDFKAGAVREGTQAFKDLVDTVDFPKFVSGLIEGVFTSIVNSSIRQMHEFGKFLEGVTKSLKEFADDNVDDKSGRDWLQSRFPKALRSNPQSGRLAMNEDIEDSDRPDFKAVLGLAEQVDLSDEEGEKKLVESARLKVARMRQQQLATMVMLGINRIVVTEGEIKASVTFDVKASDTARRGVSRGVTDTNTSVQAHSSGGWFSDDDSRVETKVSTAHNNIREDSDSKVEAKANLTGSVKVRFKSETFPLEKLANPMEMSAVNEKAAR